MKKLLFLTAISLFFSSATVFAEHHEGDMKKDKMSMADKNGDGMISMQEFTDSKVEYFKKYDKNSDGQLDKSEQDMMKEKKMKRMKMHKKEM